MLITYRERDITGAEFSDMYYMSIRHGCWTMRALLHVLEEGQATKTLVQTNAERSLAEALDHGEVVYLAGEDPNLDANRYVPYSLNVINSRFSDFVEFCNDTTNNNHVEGSEVNEAARKILNEREAVGAEYADVFIQWLLYGEVVFG